MKRTTVKSLQAEIAELIEQSAAKQATIEQRDLEIAALKQSQSEHDALVSELSSKLQVARKAILPFVKKTERWEWPADPILAISPVTFGDLRAVRNAAVEIGDR